MNQQQKPLQPAAVVSGVPLQEQFAQALKVQDKSDRTVKAYVDAMKMFIDFCKIPPLRATIIHIRAFLYYLIHEKRYAPRTYNQIMYGVKAFYEIFLPDVPLVSACIRRKTDKPIIMILDSEEIQAMIECTDNLKHRALIEVLYGSGIRVSECAKLTVSDIDRKNMLLKVNGKGGYERLTILAHNTLRTLEQYYTQVKPQNFLFEGYHHKQITTHMIEIAVRNAAKRVGIKKK